MADIRINALATTATTPASDDYLALDGTAQGTRKILATNIANNVTDVILGTSGPSVKSSLSARAPRQGLVFDGTAGATVASVPAFGTGDFTISAWINATALADNKAICDGVNSLGIWLKANGAIQLWNRVGGAALYTSSASTIATGKSYLITYARGRLYVNGIDVSGAITDTTNYSGGITAIGDVFNTGAAFSGFVSVLIYNRALSASEVVALYEAGAPAGADYNSASNTAINSSAFTNFNYDTFSSASATGFTAVNTSGTTEYAQGNPVSITGLKYGNVIRVTYSLTLNSGQLPQVVLGNIGTETHSAFYSLTAGSNQTVDIVVSTNSGTSTNIAFRSTAASNYSISSVSAQRIGLLLAPDAAQAGGGLVWYDTSGNAANITLPASGVSWNVPSSRYLGGNWTTSGNLTVSGRDLTLGSSESVIYFGTPSANYLYYSGSSLFLRVGSVDRITIPASTGNVLIGTTTDSGNGKLQLATHTTSAGGIGFGTDTSLYRQAAGTLILSTGSYASQIASVSAGFYIGAATAGMPTVLTSGGGSPALTLDSSQNATFAGTSVTVDGASTGSTLTLKRASNANGAIISYKTTTTSKWYHGLRGLVDDNWYLQNDVAGNTALFFDASTSNATFVGSIAIGNTVNTVSPTSPNRTITMVIGGTTYYIHAKTTND